MIRALIAVAVATAVVSAQEPTGEPLYFPTKEGTKRVYEQRFGDVVSQTVDTVTRVEAKGTGFLVSVTRESGKAGKKLPVVYEVSGKGVFRVSTGDRVERTPDPLLKLPAKAGDTWTTEVTGPASRGAITTKYKIGAEVEIEVPAGKFKAIPVESESEVTPGRPQTGTIWHAPGVGVVKTTTRFGGNDTVTVLKSFTPGK